MNILDIFTLLRDGIKMSHGQDESGETPVTHEQAANYEAEQAALSKQDGEAKP